MATQTRVNGLAGDVGVLNGKLGASVGASVKFYKLTAKTTAAAAVDLRTLDDATNEAFELIMRAMPSGILAFYAADDASGVVSIVVDGHAAPLASTGDANKPGLQEIMRALGSAAGPLGGSLVDLTGTTVEAAVGFTVLV